MKTTHKSLGMRNRTLTQTTLAIGLPSLILGSAAQAQEEEAIVLDTLEIEERTIDTNPYSQKGAPYKARISGDNRHTRELAETPQTITVLTQTQIQDSGKSDLKEILDAQPGISLGTGENGNAFGDRYVIRGHEARSDVFVDGMRDPGMTTRESFAVEQIEITKGPSSTFAGRGSTGGAINAITKQASTEYSFNKLQAGAGTDDYRRITGDSNFAISDDIALRANILHAYEEVPDRAPADRERNGVALAAAFQVNDRLGLNADLYYLDAEDKPDLGAYIDRDTGNVVGDVPVYLQDEDFLESEVKTGTFSLNYLVSDSIRFENSARYGTTDNGYFVTGTRAGDRDASDPAGAIPTLSLSNHQGWQEVDYLADQANLFWTTNLGGKEHEFIFSFEYTQHEVLNGTYDVAGTNPSNCLVSGRGGVSEGFCIVDESGNYINNISNLIGRDIVRSFWDSDYDIETLSLAVMDTFNITDTFSAFVGLRMDSFDYTNTVYNSQEDTFTDFDYSDELFNYHLGLVYDIADNGNVYVTYSTSSNINGGESDVGGSCGYGGICGEPETIGRSEPEQTENFEVGTKWNLFGDRLLATAAAFHITKDDVMEGADYETTGTLNTGKNRVEGIELSLTGNITNKLSTQFGASLMNAEILETAATNRDGSPVETGGTLANFAEKSAFLQLRYQVTPSLAFGGSANYSSEVFVGQPDSPANEDLGVPSYTVFDFFAQYQLNQQLSFRLNVGNVTDKEYYLTAYRSGAFTYIGDARNAQFAVSYEF